jgi:hypothetical protein
MCKLSKFSGGFFTIKSMVTILHEIYACVPAKLRKLITLPKLLCLIYLHYLLSNPCSAKPATTPISRLATSVPPYTANKTPVTTMFSSFTSMKQFTES